MAIWEAVKGYSLAPTSRTLVCHIPSHTYLLGYGKGPYMGYAIFLFSVAFYKIEPNLWKMFKLQIYSNSETIQI
jgi:hypothetical protein